MATLAVMGNEVTDVLDALGRQTAAQVSGVPGLAAGRATGGLLGTGLGCAWRVGGRGQRGVSGIAAELGLQLTDVAFQGSEALP